MEEKTEGKYHKEDCITISLDELNALDVQGIKDKLMSAQNMAKIIVNAVSYADLKVFCAALVLAMKAGKHYMVSSYRDSFLHLSHNTGFLYAKSFGSYVR